MAHCTDGFVLAARGPAYVATALEAGRSLRQAMPDAAIDLYADVAVPAATGVFDLVHLLEGPSNVPKFESLLRSRFRKTVYLDADTRCTAEMRDIFRVLDRFDIAMAHDPFRNSAHARRTWRMPLPNAFPHLNGGLIAVRAARETRVFLQDVRDTMMAFGLGTDQAINREKLFASDLRLHVLPPEYNLLDYRQAEMWGSLHAAPRLIHHSKFRKVTGNRLKDVRTLRALVGPDMDRHFRRLIAADHALSPGTETRVRPLVETGVFGQLRQGTRSLRKGILRILRL